MSMETKEIAKKLVAYCRKADWDGAHNELYDENAISTEPYATEDFPKQTKGLKAIQEKSKTFEAMVEKIHSIEVSEPLIAGNSIAFTLRMDITMKEKGRMNSPELCVYQVRDGKIISEEFFV
jgi:hypothetical protein